MILSPTTATSAPPGPPRPTSAGNPFDDAAHRATSCYLGTRDGRPFRVDDPKASPDLFASLAVGAFRGFVQNPQFSCVGAKSAANGETQRFGVYGPIDDPAATLGLARDLFAFTREVEDARDDVFRSFAAIFHGPTDMAEADFEQALWDLLRRLNALDARHHDWDQSVSANPDDPHFGFSFGGMALFVVGLHPHSSREARRFAFPTLVFNPHAQFERLKVEGRYNRLRDVVRSREQTLQGSLNPNLADHGAVTEARQYSGRAVEADWHPPFTPMARSIGGCPYLASLGASR